MQVTMIGLLWATFGCGGDKDAPTGDSATSPPVDTSTLVCDPGTADCNANPSDGCEASLSARTTCGGCDVVCDADQVCASDGCADLQVTSVLQVALPVIASNFDAEGFTYLGGRFSEPTDFGDGIETPTGVDIFVARYTPEGRLDWVQTVPVPDGRREFPYDLELGPDDSVYMAGELEHAANFGDGVSRGDATDSESHGFVAKWTEAGSFQWADDFMYSTAVRSTYAEVLAVSDDQVVIAGRTPPESWFFGAYDAQTGAKSAPQQFESDNDTPGRNVIPNGVAIAPNGNVFVAGQWEGNWDFGDGDRDAKNAGRGWVSSYTSGGAFRWFEGIDPSKDRYSYARDVAAPSDDEVYVTAFDAGSDVVDAKVIRYTGLGEIVWTTSSSPANEGSLLPVALATHGPSLYLLASIEGEVRFGGLTVASAPDDATPAEPSTDVAVFSLDTATGAVRWAQVVGNSSDERAVGFKPNIAAHEGGIQFLVETTGPLVLPDGTVVEPAGTPSLAAIRIRE